MTFWRAQWFLIDISCRAPRIIINIPSKKHYFRDFHDFFDLWCVLLNLGSVLGQLWHENGVRKKCWKRRRNVSSNTRRKNHPGACGSLKKKNLRPLLPQILQILHVIKHALDTYWYPHVRIMFPLPSMALDSITEILELRIYWSDVLRILLA